MGMKTSEAWKMTASEPRIEWSEVKRGIDMAMVTTNLLGPAFKRQGSRLIWPCPFHDDQHPSFEVDLTKKLWICRACGIGGDAAELVMRHEKVTFGEAVHFLADLSGVIPPSRGPTARPPPSALATPVPPSEQPSGLPLNEASTLVDEAAACLWGAEGRTARDYLRGRGLTHETIRAAGLGFTPGAMIPTRAGDRAFRFSGVTIPWRDGNRLTRIKVRRLDDGEPKYVEAFQDNPLIYPDPAAVRPGDPLVVCEGEFDCLLLAQQLPEASVITLGSASARTDPAVLVRMLSAPRWFVALDGDEAGDRAAAKFPGRSIRVRPPAPNKDWGEVHAGGPNRIRYHWGCLLSHATPWEQLEPKGDLDQLSQLDSSPRFP
jgi:DNA primase